MSVRAVFMATTLLLTAALVAQATVRQIHDLLRRGKVW